jgi:hypothetical protein
VCEIGGGAGGRERGREGERRECTYLDISLSLTHTNTLQSRAGYRSLNDSSGV